MGKAKKRVKRDKTMEAEARRALATAAGYWRVAGGFKLHHDGNDFVCEQFLLWVAEQFKFGRERVVRLPAILGLNEELQESAWQRLVEQMKVTR